MLGVMEWQVIGVLIAVMLLWSGVLFWAVKWLLDGYRRHVDDKFGSLEEANKNEAEQWRRVDREIMELRAELPNLYVRRDDFIRSNSVIDARLETVNEKLSRLLERRGDEKS